MPELPEVETVVRGLRSRHLPGRRVVRVSVFWPRTVATPTLDLFCRRLQGRLVLTVDRRGKYIVLTLDSGEAVLVHLRMTGKLQFAAPSEPRSPHHHVVLDLDDGRQLRYHDTRKFGRWSLLANPDEVLGRMGPEPLDPAFTAPVLRNLLARRARMLKPLLLDQAVLAGMGNIYVDEALWDARLHPCRNSATLTTAEVTRLHAGIRTVLQRGVDAQGTTLGRGSTNFYSVAGRRGRNQDGLRVFRRTGEPCPRCEASITRLIVGQRSTHICPSCQPGPRRRRA